jgi:hypothetical protein
MVFIDSSSVLSRDNPFSGDEESLYRLVNALREVLLAQGVPAQEE